MNDVSAVNHVVLSAIEKSPFQVGDFVMLKTSQLKLKKFRHYFHDDVGVVVDTEKNPKGYWLIHVYWQKFISKKGINKLKHTRLKKARKGRSDV